MIALLDEIAFTMKKRPDMSLYDLIHDVVGAEHGTLLEIAIREDTVDDLITNHFLLDTFIKYNRRYNDSRELIPEDAATVRGTDRET